MAVGLRQLGTVDQSVDFFLKLAALDTAPPEVDTEDERIDLVRVDTNLKVRRDRWIAVNLGEILAQADEASRQRIDATINARFDEVANSRSLRELRQFVNYFGRHPRGAQVQLQLARALLERDQRLDAELNLVPLQESAEPAIAATATALLADLLLTAGRLPEAAACYERLARQWGDVPVRDGQTGKEVAAAALADEPLQQTVANTATWPYGKVEVVGRTAGNVPQFPEHVCDRTCRRERSVSRGRLPGLSTASRTPSSCGTRRATRSCRSRSVTSTGSRCPTSTPRPASAAAEGHLVIVNVGTDVLALDALRDATGPEDVILWRNDLSNSLVGTGMTADRRPTPSPVPGARRGTCSPRISMRSARSVRSPRPAFSFKGCRN